VSGHPIADGPLGLGAARGTALRLRRSANRWIVDGELRSVPWGERVRRVVLAERVDGVTHVIDLDPVLGEAQHRANLAGEPRTHFVFRDVTLPDGTVRAAPSLPAEIALLLAAAARTHQIAGALATARDLTLRYTADRIAFGKPLNKQQAVQQQLAVLVGQAAAASVAADMATDALQALHSGDLGLSIALAKVRAGEAAGVGAAIAHQLHGAMGFTYEHGLHHATRRLWAWRDEFGNESYWARRAGDHIAANGAAELWQTITQAAHL
jgi:alkylation response protein AidB-like acyl-CoA dehydrogenase